LPPNELPPRDPDELAAKMSNRQSGKPTFGVPSGHLMLQFSERTSVGPDPDQGDSSC
jgi:hypothetical protein